MPGNLTVVVIVSQDRPGSNHHIEPLTLTVLHAHYVSMLLLLSRFSRVRLCATPEMAAHRLPRPWDSPGKNTGVGAEKKIKHHPLPWA